ncbi:uncharacterized protein Smp_203440 [Schistosoma mansoni]|uniref:Uncharacterized protein n=1 Tax=Schistosoma mansoni TaxID=6183 RepID=G4VQN7_SCHMA|nr:uncharacterized protein Smp_203440 [Schistosoma mansoni]|eukprot:XP_018654095.1 uncharacterized protein Smp_203440 [Schistosoma mansoni]
MIQRILVCIVIFTFLDVLMYCNSHPVKPLLKDLAEKAPIGIPQNCGPRCRYYYDYLKSGRRGKMYVYYRT